MSRNALLLDAVIAAILTILVVVLSPGLAIVGLIAVLVVLICLVSFAIDGLRRRSKHKRQPREPLGGRRSRPPT